MAIDRDCYHRNAHRLWKKKAKNLKSGHIWNRIWHNCTYLTYLRKQLYGKCRNGSETIRLFIPNFIRGWKGRMNRLLVKDKWKWWWSISIRRDGNWFFWEYGYTDIIYNRAHTRGRDIYSLFIEKVCKYRRRPPPILTHFFLRLLWI